MFWTRQEVIIIKWISQLVSVDYKHMEYCAWSQKNALTQSSMTQSSLTQSLSQTSLNCINLVLRTIHTSFFVYSVQNEMSSLLKMKYSHHNV